MQTIEPVEKPPENGAGKGSACAETMLETSPNMYRTLANSGNALKSLLSAMECLQDGRLSTLLADKIALAVVGEAGSDYCKATHLRTAREAGIPVDEARLNLQGISTDGRTGIVLSFAVSLVRARCRMPRPEVEFLRENGFNDEEILEIVAHVSVTLFGCHVNLVAGTELEPHNQ